MTIGKLYQTLLLCTAVVVTSILCSCAAEDNNPLTEEVEEEVEIEEVTKPEPSWADGIVTITTGNYQNLDDLIFAVRKKRNFHMTLGKVDLINMDIPLPSEPKTVDITAITLEEAGFTERVTLEEIRERFRQLGYRPLTMEEVIEFRLQFEDQPDIAQEDLTEEARKWSRVLILLNESGSEKRPPLLGMARSSLRDNVGEGFMLGTAFGVTFDPYVKNTWKKSWFAKTQNGSVFACAIIK